jgi:hypothetical protein
VSDLDLMRDAAKWIRSYHGQYREGEASYATMLTARGIIGSFVTEHEALTAENARLWEFVRAWDDTGSPTWVENLRAARAALGDTP